jgi:hypothetical protein
MFKKFLLAVMIALPLTLARTNAQDSASEDAKTRLSKQEIVSLIVSTGRIPAQQQSSRIDAILADPSRSKTPRSDFLFCSALAYMGSYKAQYCVGSAYENARGIVEDLSEAYVWYAIAAESHSADKTAEQRIQDERDRLKTKLQTTYPSPSDDELDDLVKTQKLRIEQYREEAGKARK